jgi:hypothetical protein
MQRNREFPDAYQGKFFEEQVSLAEATLAQGLLVGGESLFAFGPEAPGGS